MNIELGQKVRDKITGFEGIATARVEYINGCVQYCVKPKVKADGTMPDGQYLDHAILELVDDGIFVKSSDTGGPQTDCPKG